MWKFCVKFIVFVDQIDVDVDGTISPISPLDCKRIAERGGGGIVIKKGKQTSIYIVVGIVDQSVKVCDEFRMQVIVVVGFDRMVDNRRSKNGSGVKRGVSVTHWTGRSAGCWFEFDGHGFDVNPINFFVEPDG